MSANFLPSVLNQAVAKAITTLQEFADSPLFAERFTAVFGTSIAAPRFRALLASLTFPAIFLFERSPNFLLSQSLILSSAIVIKSSLLKTANSLKPLFGRHFQT